MTSGQACESPKPLIMRNPERSHSRPNVGHPATRYIASRRRAIQTPTTLHHAAFLPARPRLHVFTCGEQPQQTSLQAMMWGTCRVCMFLHTRFSEDPCSPHAPTCDLHVLVMRYASPLVRSSSQIHITPGLKTTCMLLHVGNLGQIQLCSQ